LDGENGKVTVSQLERGARKITLEMALAYAEIFDVSLDYICGRSDDPQPENKGIRESTGLEDDAIAMLKWLAEPLDMSEVIHPLSDEELPVEEMKKNTLRAVNNLLSCKMGLDVARAVENKAGISSDESMYVTFKDDPFKTLLLNMRGVQSQVIIEAVDRYIGFRKGDINAT